MANGLLSDRERLPPLFQPQPVTPTMLPIHELMSRRPTPDEVAASQGPPQLSVWDKLAGLVGAGRDPNLGIRDNDELRRMALQRAGLATLLASSQPGASALGSIAQGALAGQQYGTSLRDQLRMKAGLRQLIRRLPPEQAAVLGALPPEMQMEVLQGMLTRQPQVVGAGGALVSPTGEVLYQGTAKTADLPAELRGIAALMGLDLTQLTPEQSADLLKTWEGFRERSGTRVSIDARAPTEKVVDEVMGKQYAGAVELHESSRRQLQNIAAAEALLDEGMTTGRLEEMTLPLRQIAAGLGIGNAQNLGMQEAFRGIANRMALDAKTGMTGPMSDRDIMFLQNQVPQISNTVLGNRILIEIARRTANFNQARALEMDRWLSEPGRDSARGLLAHMAEWERNHPIDLSDLRARAYGEFDDLVGGGR